MKSPNKHMQRAGIHKVRGRGRPSLVPCSAPRARVLTGQRTGADVNRYAARPIRGALAAIALLLAASCGSDTKKVSIDTPSGEVTYKETTTTGVEDFKDVVAEVTAEERAGIAADAARAIEFIAAYVPANQQTQDLLEDLDLAFSAWLVADQQNLYTSDDVVRIVGSSLGEVAVRDLHLRWARVSDDHGTDLALIADKPPTRSYPFTSVQYRIEDKKTDFIVALHETLKHTMATASQ